MLEVWALMDREFWDFVGGANGKANGHIVDFDDVQTQTAHKRRRSENAESSAHEEPVVRGKRRHEDGGLAISEIVH